LLLTLAAGLRPSPLTSLLLLEVGREAGVRLVVEVVLGGIALAQEHQVGVHLLNPL
jgi:hypothetical protein